MKTEYYDKWCVIEAPTLLFFLSLVTIAIITCLLVLYVVIKTQRPKAAARSNKSDHIIAYYIILCVIVHLKIKRWRHQCCHTLSGIFQVVSIP